MKRIRSWKFWDWKSIFRATLILSIIALAVLFIPVYQNWSRNKAGNSMTEKSIGHLLEAKPINHISMGLDGNKTVTHAYEIKYRYKVHSISYNSTDRIPNNSTYSKFINDIFENNKRTFPIKYDSKAPNSSQIVIN